MNRRLLRHRQWISGSLRARRTLRSELNAPRMGCASGGAKSRVPRVSLRGTRKELTFLRGRRTEREVREIKFQEVSREVSQRLAGTARQVAIVYNNILSELIYLCNARCSLTILLVMEM